MNPKIDIYLVSYKVSSEKNVFDMYPIPNLMVDLSQLQKQGQPIKANGKRLVFVGLLKMNTKPGKWMSDCWWYIFSSPDNPWSRNVRNYNGNMEILVIFWKRVSAYLSRYRYTYYALFFSFYLCLHHTNSKVKKRYIPIS